MSNTKDGTCTDAPLSQSEISLKIQRNFRNLIITAKPLSIPDISHLSLHLQALKIHNSLQANLHIRDLRLRKISTSISKIAPINPQSRGGRAGALSELRLAKKARKENKNGHVSRHVKHIQPLARGKDSCIYVLGGISQVSHRGQRISWK